MGHERATSHGPSFLRWAGSKRKSVVQLAAAYVDNARHYVEPFAGSATVFFSVRPVSATLADLNGHLVNSLRAVRDQPEELHKGLASISRDSKTYYQIRSEFNDLRPYGLRSAILFVYLNRNCFNGLWRTNQKGAFNVPYGGTEMGTHPPLALLMDCSEALKRTRLRHQDFRKTLADAGDGDFVYADPPYFTATERTFIEYGQKSFGQKDLDDLMAMLLEASERGAQVALTYSASMPLREIPVNWTSIDFEVTRNVGGFRGSRKKHRETLYTNGVIGEQR